MTVRQPRYTKEEHARKGTELYEQQVRPLVEAGNEGNIVAIDIDTGAFEVAEQILPAAERLLARYPDAQIWFVRIGHQSVHRIRPLKQIMDEIGQEAEARGLTPEMLESLLHGE